MKAWLLLAVLCAAVADDRSIEWTTDASPALTDFSDANSSDQWSGGGSRPSETEPNQGVGRYQKKTPSTKPAKTKTKTKATFSHLLANVTSSPTTHATAKEEKTTTTDELALIEPSLPTPTAALATTASNNAATAAGIQVAKTTVATSHLPMKFTVGVGPKNTKKVVTMSLVTTTTPPPVSDHTRNEATTTNSSDWPMTAYADAIPPRVPMKFTAGVQPKNAKKIVAVSLLTPTASPVARISAVDSTTASYEDVVSSFYFEPLKIPVAVRNTPSTTTTEPTSTALPNATEEKTQFPPSTLAPFVKSTEAITTHPPAPITAKVTSTTTPLPYAAKRKLQLKPSTVTPATTTNVAIPTTNAPTTTITKAPASSTTYTKSPSPYVKDVTTQTKSSTTIEPATETFAPVTTERQIATPLPYMIKRTTVAEITTTTTTTTQAPTTTDVIAEYNEIVSQATAMAPIVERHQLSVPPVAFSTSFINQKQIAPVWFYNPPPPRGTLVFNPSAFQLPAAQQFQRASMHHFNLVNRIPLIHNRSPHFFYAPSTFRAI